MNVFDTALEKYQYHSNTNNGHREKYRIINDVNTILKEYFPFNTINCIETGGSHNWKDGMMGLYYCYLSSLSNGVFHSVDINPSLHSKIIESFNTIDSSLPIQHTTSDSVDFLSSIDFSPNLVLLDSWDLDLTNPFPSALHGWREFETIKDKMVSGSIIVIDDNFMKGTWIEWVVGVDGNGHNIQEFIEIKYPIVGKGAHIYQWIQDNDTDWKVINNPTAGQKVQIIIQKQ